MSNHQQRNQSGHAVSALIGGWGMAGLMGLTLAVTVALRGPFDTLPTFVQGLLGIAAGWTILMLCAPWRLLSLFRHQRRTIGRLAAQLESISADRACPRLPHELLTRQDEIGRLCRAVQDVACELDNCRRQRRSLQKSMNHRITSETRRATAQLHSQATTDPLTGLGNRRHVHRWVTEMLDGDDAARADTTLVAMAVDIDLFKPVNDLLGHDAGDECLTFLGELLRSSIRHGHCAARLGGDEFIVLMTDISVEQAGVVAERLSTLFAQMPWPHLEPRRPTLSIGLAEATAAQHDDIEALIRAADQALYTSKRNGRGRWSVHRQPQGSPIALHRDWGAPHHSGAA